LCNPDLSHLITEKIGDQWITNLDELKKLEKFIDDIDFLTSLQEVKRANKERLAAYILQRNGVEVKINSIFDCQVKRIHEYKRQLLNILHIIALYNQLRLNPRKDIVPRTFIFSGKAAPGYTMAKLIIKLINSVADVVNNDKTIKDKIKVVFLADYSVSLAQLIIPAADISEQISTAGFEASGTGNMKFALNGALTVGTLDGANIEIMEEVGKDNIFIFGLPAEEVHLMHESGYDPLYYYNQSKELKIALDMVIDGHFSPSESELFRPIIESLLYEGDKYMLLADFEAYLACQARVNETYKDTKKWARMTLKNIAYTGRFSSDRTINEYAKEIWKAKPVSIEMSWIQ